MKAKVFLFIFMVSARCLPVAGQQYSVDWFTIDGGGGTSTGGIYSIEGTIGQPDAGTMNGGQYSLTGGFWSLICIVQTDGAPLLTITRSGNDIIVSWPADSAGWTLQQSEDIASAHWPNSDYPISDDGTRKS